MSTGSVTKGTGNNPKEETQLEYAQAHQWCIEMRSILGNVVKQKIGLGTDAKKLAEAEQKVYDRLKKLNELFPEGMPKEARELEAEYSKLAKEGFLLREQYVQYEEDIKRLQKQRDNLQKERSIKETLKRDTSRVDHIDVEIEKLKELQESKKQEIADKAGEFLGLADGIKEKVDDRIKQKEDYVKKLKENNLSPEVIKKINEARANWKKQKKIAEGLVEYFSGNCDTKASSECSQEFEKCRIDIYSILSVGDAMKLLGPMEVFVAKWGVNGKKKQYEEARKRFEIVYKTAPNLMTEVQKVSEGKELEECLKLFTQGQSLALVKNWIEADKLINETFLERLRTAINVGSNFKGAWQKASEELQGFKNSLDQIADPGFTILALKPLGEAYKLAEEKNYLEATQKFNENKAKSLETIKVAGLVESVRRNLSDTANANLELIAMIPQGPMSMLANQYITELQNISNDFWNERHVATETELNALVDKYTKRLDAIKKTLQSYTSTDPETQKANLELVEDLKNGRNKDATIQIIKSLVDSVAPAIRSYEAAFYNPAGQIPAEPLGTWKRQLNDAIEFHKALTAEKDSLNDPNAIKGEYILHTSNLDGLAKKILDVISQQTTAINQVRGQINEALDWFKTKMFVTRLDTVFKEATWHKEAKLEHEELLAMATVNNLAQLQDVLARALKLKERCDRVLSAMPRKFLDSLLDSSTEGGGPIFDGTQAQNDYDKLKQQLDSVRSDLKDKDLRLYVPRGVEKVSSELSSADSQLRSDGYPGLLDAPVLQKHTDAVAAVRKSLTNLKQLFGSVKPRREQIRQKLVDFRVRITKELEPAIEKVAGGTISGEHLPIMQATTLLDLRLNTEDMKEFDAIESELSMLGDDLTLLLLSADEPNGLKDQVEAVKNGEAKKDETLKLKLEARMQYESSRKQFDEIWKGLRSRKDVDQRELDVIRTIKNQATEATQSKPENWTKGTKDIKLAILLAERLQKDPLASQSTDRGQSNLKELTPRWIRGIERINETVNAGLHNAILKSCEADTENVADAAGISNLFKSKIGSKFDKSSLKEDAFAAELLILQRLAPKKSEAKAADKKEKKKAREQALVKLRYYKQIVQKDPMFQNLLFKKNPWTNDGGNVDGLPLMRAINDIELNVERGIY